MASHNVPGAYPSGSFSTRATSNMTSAESSRVVDTTMREGKFPDLTTFFAADEEQLRKLVYRPPQTVGMRPGSIIHVFDKNGHESRLHNRVLLVKTAGPSSMLCVSFEKHEPELEKENDKSIHWRAIREGTMREYADPAGFSAVEVPLNYHIAIAKGITINLRDLWNVEYEVSVAKLGEITGSSWTLIRNRINQIFTQDQLIAEAMEKQGGETMKRKVSAGGEKKPEKRYYAVMKTSPSPKEKERKLPAQASQWGSLF